jgi:hypothetical protein
MSSHTSRRMSLGAGAQRRVLGEASSRFNSSYGSSADGHDLIVPQKSYVSSGAGIVLEPEFIGNDGGSAPGSSRRRSSSAPRRQSFGGEGLLSHHRQLGNGTNTGETPIRDRRAMLQAWRQAREGESNSIDATRKRTARGEPPLPPTSKHPKMAMTATSAASAASLSQDEHRSRHSTVNYFDDDDENRTIGGGSTILFSVRTPSSRRGMGSARRKSILGRSVFQSNDGKANTRK